ncbi:hypothetical protein AND_006474 [Anopheles darlingi]|uniref:CLIP domain-containing serine protease n=1 Tax=Anopheles darlingi TaxID=43151 RepID=W5JGA9_ANODA|nr:hypothetical protein AND_006474 [Anopheles darlingi]
MSLDEICWKLLLFPWLVKFGHWKPICLNHFKTTTPFPFITLPFNYTFPPSTPSSSIPFTPLTSPSLTFSTGSPTTTTPTTATTTTTGLTFTSTTFLTTTPTVPVSTSSPFITQTIPLPPITFTNPGGSQGTTPTPGSPTFPTLTVTNPSLTSIISTSLFPTVTFTNPPAPTGSTIPGGIFTSTSPLTPITPITGISPLPTFPTFLTTINPPTLTSTSAGPTTTVSCPTVPQTCPPSVLLPTTPGQQVIPSIDPRQLFNGCPCIDPHDSCLAPNGQNGICIVYANCDFILQLLIRNSYLHDASIENYVVDSICGYSDTTPMVCCPTLRFAQSTSTAGVTSSVTSSTSSGSFYFTNIPSSGTTTTTTTTISPNPATPGSPSGSAKLPVNDVDRCGMSNATHLRVVGGVDAQLNAWPWMAALGYRISSFELNSGPRFLCGGTLITTTHVLTASHCVQTGLYFVRLGEYDITSDQDGASPIDVYIQRSVIHERYNEKTIQNDIALLLLQRSITVSDAIRPICLPLDSRQRTKDLTYYAPFIAGWGAIAHNGPTATKLQEAQVVVLPVDQCAFNYKLYFPNQIFDETVVCAGFPQGGKDSCQGDSGGPLMLPELSSNGQYYYYTQIGIVSYGYECARAGFPGVYVKVSAYLPWIEANLNF